MKYEATLKAKLSEYADTEARIRCKAGEKTYEEKDMIAGVDKIDVGTTTKKDFTAWFLEPLAEAPSSCTIGFYVGEVGEPLATPFDEFCFVPPSTTTPGACK